MNKIYRVIWNGMTGTWTAVQENARACGKRTRSKGPGAAVLAGAVVAAGIFAGAPAWAQCVGDPGGYTCSGTITSGVSLAATSGDITVTSTANITPTADPGTGIYVDNTGSGNVTIDQTSGTITGYGSGAPGSGAGIVVSNGTSGGSIFISVADTVSGPQYGIVAGNNGLGATRITTAGDVSGISYTGISVYNGTTATDLTVTQTGGSISGGASGIYAQNDGTGATRITTDGDVSGAGLYGIYAANRASATDLTVAQTAGGITGGRYGIVAENKGTGATSVTTVGDVTAGSDGIRAINGPSTTDLTVTQESGSISGGKNGIWAENNGTGATSITTAGDITVANGTSEYGIYVTNAASATDLTVTQESGSISSDMYGIFATNNGTGSTSITTAGDVSAVGAVATGLEVFNEGTATDLTVSQTAGHITGTNYGIVAQNNGVGATSVTIAGDVTGNSYDSVSVYNSASATDLTVSQTAGSITGGHHGIVAQNHGTGATSVTTNGDVSATSAHGVYVDNDVAGTNVTVSQTAGNIVGSGYGIWAGNHGTGDTNVTIAGDVTGNRFDGVRASNFASTTGLTVTQTAGSISGADNGIWAYNAGSGPMSVTIAGDVIGGNTAGIFAWNTGTAGLAVTQTTGNISGARYGIDVYNNGTGATGIVTAGDVFGGDSGIAVYNDTTATDLTVLQTGGSISSGNYGILAENDGTGTTSITTKGDVSGADGSGISVYNTTTATDLTVTQTGGSISGRDAGINVYNLGVGATRITTAGDVNSTSGIGIAASNLASATDLVITQESGSITGGYGGVWVENYGVGATNITIGADVTGRDSYGIHAINAGFATDLTVTQTGGSIVGGTNGIAASNLGNGATSIVTAGNVSGAGGYGIYVENNPLATDLTVRQTGGSISGSSTGILARNYGTGVTDITTDGDVFGGSSDGIYVFNDTGATNQTVTQTSGNISSAYFGIEATNLGAGATSITTAGNVTGGVDGINVYNYALPTSLTITQQSGSIVGENNGIRAANLGTGPTAISVAGTVTGGTGAAILTQEAAGTAVTIELKSGAEVSAASGLAIQDTEGDATVTLESGSKIDGAVRLGNGNNSLTVIGAADIGGTSAILDAGNDADTSGTTTNILGTPGAGTNKLTFLDGTQTLAGTNLLNWQSIALDGSSVTLADGTLVTGAGTHSDGSLQGLVLKNASTLASPVTLAVTGDVAIDATSTLRHDVGGAIAGNVTNAGQIYWGNLGRTLSVNGNYTGVAGSSLSLETWLADDSSTTDRMVVNGNTSGTSSLIVRAISGSPGAQTDVGIDVIEVSGTSAGTFTMASPVEAGAYQYVLKQGGNGGNAGDWYLVSTYIDPTTPTDPGTSSPGSPGDSFPIYRPGVGGYTLTPLLNLDYGFSILGSLHQRVGDVPGAINPQQGTAGNGVWGRVKARSFDAHAGRFSTNSSTYFAQFGKDWTLDQPTDGGSTHAGVMATFGHTSATFHDKLRSIVDLDTRTGTVSTQAGSLGGYWTRYLKDGTYFDSVGQVTYYHNRFGGQDGSPAQNGVGVVLSQEVGKPFQIGSTPIAIEPQVQLMYQYLSLGDFSDATSAVSGTHTNALRGRAGFRIFGADLPNSEDHNPLSWAKPYLTFNVLHDFLRPGQTVVGGTSFNPTFSRTWMDVGAGVTAAAGKHGELYGHGGYQHSLGGGNSQGFYGQLSYRYKW